MPAGLVVLVVALVVATAFGLVRARTDGRMRVTTDPRPDPSGGTGPGAGPQVDGTATPAASTAPTLGHADLGSPLGERATLLQFSSAFCAPCRTTRVVLADVAHAVPGVAHVEVDAESHLDLVRRLGILRTPTVLVLDAHGREVRRAAGAPRRAQVLAAVEAAMEGTA